MAKSLKEVLKSTRDNFIALIFFVALHILADFFWLIVLGHTPKITQVWSVISLVVVGISLGLAVNIYINIKDNPNKEIVNLFIFIISFLAVHAAWSLYVLFHGHSYITNKPIIYGVSLVDLFINGGLILTLIFKHKILDELT